MYERIRNMREDVDLKQKDMSRILSIGQTTYSDYELGKLNIPINILTKLAAYHNTSVDYLLGLTDVREPYPRSKEDLTAI